MELYFTGTKLIALLGLAFDVLGAWYISRGLMRKTKEDIVSETGFSWAPNDNYIIGGLIQKIECNIGFYALLLGFTLQGFSTLLAGDLMNATLRINQALISLGCEFIVLFITYKCLEHYIKRSSKSIVREHVKSIVNEHLLTSESPKHPSDTRRLLGYLGISAAEDTPAEDVWNRLLVAIKE